MRTQLTFEDHFIQSNETPPAIRWHRDLAPTIDIIEAIKAAKYDPTVEVATGLLQHEWEHDGKKHPYYAVVIAPDINLLPSDRIAVSKESFEDFIDK